MTKITAKAVQALRAKTGAGVMDVKQALLDATGDEKKALALLKKRGQLKAAKKGSRAATEGVIHAYVHGNHRVGVLLELSCETDFVARNKDFQALAHDLCLQIAAGNPQVIHSDDTPTEEDPATVALLAQPFVKEPEQTVGDVVTALVSKFGENIRVARFTRYELGQGENG